MIRIDYRDGKAIYEQVRDEFKMMIIRNLLKEHEQLPSIREIALSLSINPNTIQRAYKELEAEGFIYSVKGKGSFVAPMPTMENSKRIQELMEELKNIVSELHYLGQAKEEICKALGCTQ